MRENNLLSKYGGTVFAKITAFLILDIFFLTMTAIFAISHIKVHHMYGAKTPV
jgi:hypothetical protein